MPTEVKGNNKLHKNAKIVRRQVSLYILYQTNITVDLQSTIFFSQIVKKQ
jgi:hypothetical protein